MSSIARPAVPDQSERERALDPSRSILVQAPAGSGKTDLLTRRFLRLLAEVDDPAHIVAITFTKAAAAEMRHRILAELEHASTAEPAPTDDEFSMPALAARALHHARALGWNLVDLPAVLRISTIDSFCREIALRRPLLSTVAGGVDVTDQPDELYHRAARRTLLNLNRDDLDDLRESIATLLQWRDNNWQELEDQLVLMLRTRDRWMHEFWLRDFHARTDDASWNELRERLERPFARAIAASLAHLTSLLDRVPGAWNEAVELAQFACANADNVPFRELAEAAACPAHPFESPAGVERAHQIFSCLAELLLTKDGGFRQRLDKNIGFPQGTDAHKARHKSLTSVLAGVDGLQSALNAIRSLPPAHYSDEDWHIVRACFTLLRQATAELHVAFAESGKVDFTEIAQTALSLLRDDEGQPSEAAISIADEIHHLLVDEFQDTSRRQHELIRAIAGAWPDTRRTLFVVGDPMQSIYFFRDADAELFPRVQSVGFEIPGGNLVPRFVRLSSNFRTTPELVIQLNRLFEPVFAINDGSNVRFSPSEPVRYDTPPPTCFDLHLKFVQQNPHASSPDAKREAIEERQRALEEQTAEIVNLIRSRIDQIDSARAAGRKYRIAVLGRARSALAPVAQALRQAGIPFRAVDLEPLAARPEILDVLALARALHNPEDRLAWLGVLRAPWCGLSLRDLHTLTSDDDPDLKRRPIPDLIRERTHLLSPDARVALDRLQRAITDAVALRASVPTLSLGTWLEQVWLRLGGDACVDAAARANLNQLWRCLDQLPEGAPDLLGPSFQSALSQLTALPDPSVDSSCGVQLMTIHKSKGLEFEVVILPDLQAKNGRSKSAMFSWLERGLESSADSEEPTEFLIAPFQPRGSERGQTRAWVDSQYRAKELQEMRRILYVAATRAREELHLFARPEYKMDNGAAVLCDPAESLLKNAWPALGPSVQARFDEWNTQDTAAEVDALAAGAEVIPMAAPGKPALLRRLPADFVPPSSPAISANTQTAAVGATSNAYQRHEGGLTSRALGSAVHRALQHLAELRSSSDWGASRGALPLLRGRLGAAARALGIDARDSIAIAEDAIQIALRASQDPIAQWILSPHDDAENEVRWTGIVNGILRTVRADRVFRAGPAPLDDTAAAWWIIDYKTAHPAGDPADILPALRAQFAPQLELYAQVLRKLHGGQVPVRAGLYYPRLLQFDWWEP